MNLNLNLSLVFLKSMNLSLNLEIENKMNGSNHFRRYGGAKGAIRPNRRFCPYVGLLKILLLKHHATTRQQTMMEKGIITFKHTVTIL